MYVMSTPEKGLNSEWRAYFKNIYTMSMSHYEYPGSKAQRVCWTIGRPKFGAQRARFKLHYVLLYTIRILLKIVVIEHVT